MLRRALAVAREMSAKGHELRVAMDLADLLERRGERAAARALLQPVYEWFTDGLDTPPLAAARERLEVLAS